MGVNRWMFGSAIASFCALLVMPTPVGGQPPGLLQQKQWVSQSPVSNPAQTRAANAVLKAADLLSKNRFQEALPYALESTQLNPQLAEGWVILGTVYLGLESVDEGVKAFLRAQQINPQTPGLALGLGLAYTESRDFLKARPLLEKAVKLHPNVVEGHLGLAYIYHHAGELAPALTQYRKAIAINPNILPAVNNIGLVQYELGDVSAAIQSWQKAQAIDRTSAEPKLALGVALFHQGEQAQGLNLITEALQLDPQLESSEHKRKILWGDRLLSDAQTALKAPSSQGLKTASNTQTSSKPEKQAGVETKSPSTSPIATQPTSPPPTSVNASKSPEETYSIASATTILIQGQNPGSGVIVSNVSNTYYVLTAKHVVATPDEYLIVTPDGKEYSVDYSKIRKLPQVDLAILEFSSNQNYQTAFLGNSDQVRLGANIYVSGWPKPGEAITKPTHIVTNGNVSGFQKEETAGYELLYNNSTAPGMSGGPVFNTEGQVVGIHGRAEGNSVSGKVGINLGIPIKLFLKFAPQAGVDLSRLGLGGG